MAAEGAPVTPTQPTKAIVAAAFTVALAVLATVQTAVSDGGITTEEWFVIAGAFLAAVMGALSVYQTSNAPKPEGAPPV